MHFTHGCDDSGRKKDALHISPFVIDFLSGDIQAFGGSDTDRFFIGWKSIFQLIDDMVHFRDIGHLVSKKRYESNFLQKISEKWSKNKIESFNL